MGFFPNIWGMSCLIPQGLIFDQDLASSPDYKEDLYYMVHLLAICSKTGHCVYEKEEPQQQFTNP